MPKFNSPSWFRIHQRSGTPKFCNPGVYTSAISGPATLNPGTYVFALSGGTSAFSGNITGTGVTIYLALQRGTRPSAVTGTERGWRCH